MDLNKLADKLKEQRPVGVTKGGLLTTDDPRNDGSRKSIDTTTLHPQRFYL